MGKERKGQEDKKSYTSWFVIIILVIFIIFAVSSGIYMWQNIKLTENEKDLKNKITDLEEKVKIYQEKIDDINTEYEKQKMDTSEDDKKYLKCKKLIDNSCQSEDFQTYKNEKLGIKFNYPKDWIVKSENITESESNISYPDIISVDFEHKDNPDIKVNFRRPILETGYETYSLEEDNTYNVNDFEIRLSTFKESKEALEEMGLEGNAENKMSLALINLKSEDYSNTYQLHMIIPDKEFDKYNKFIIQAVSTFSKLDS